MEIYGVLLDTMSIQRYIFSTNRLKENLGASYLVEDIYGSQLKETLKEMFSIDDAFLKRWKEEPENMQIIKNSVSVEIGYIGGGNAMLLFKENSSAEIFVKKWTSKLLIDSPGIIPAVAVGNLNIDSADDGKFKEGKDRLFRSLAENKGRYIPQTIIPRHGITAECPHTGYSMEVWCDELPKEEYKYLSSVSNAKIFASMPAKEKIERLLREMGLSSKYTFTDELDKLGQHKGEDSHIAIVHIDGNDMADRFKAQGNLSGLRRLSKTVREATLDTFKGLVKTLDENFSKIRDELEISSANKDILPIRPIIIGGDDITFVCDGRLGIYLAKVFLEEFEKQRVSDNKPLTACAGVAITKTKYPFYRGYQLSDDLLMSAKDKRKKENDNGSWIDFHLAYGGFSGELNEIRERHYKTPTCDLPMRPYNLSDLDELLRGIAEFKEKRNGKEIFPRSKVMELRQLLYMDENAQKTFIQELKARDKKLQLPRYRHFEGDKIIQDKKTPYFDMIELMDLYPDFALPGRQP